MLLLFSLLFPAFPARADYDPANPANLQPEDLTCSSAILVEAGTGEVIFEKNADAIIYPASTTKILTTYLGLMLNDPDRIVTVSAAAKNWRAILHFYLEELGMEFWSARLFMKL